MKQCSEADTDLSFLTKNSTLLKLVYQDSPLEEKSRTRKQPGRKSKNENLT